MNKKLNKYRSLKQKRKESKEDELEYRTWMDVLPELPIVGIILFLLLPVIWFVSQVVVATFILFRDYFEVVLFVIIIIVILAFYFYFRYWR